MWEHLPVTQRQVSHGSIVIGIVLSVMAFMGLLGAAGGLYNYDQVGTIIGLVGLIAAFAFAFGFILWPEPPARSALDE